LLIWASDEAENPDAPELGRPIAPGRSASRRLVPLAVRLEAWHYKNEAIQMKIIPAKRVTAGVYTAREEAQMLLGDDIDEVVCQKLEILIWDTVA
tara:strand:- start:1162 stop:1446 length:285 start_codon:yes stop_codon:yes gene_type:complete